MAVGERDPHTGHMTTGHEWNGIKELNTPVPRAVFLFLILTFAFAVVYWVLMPAWPLGRTYTKGLLGIDQRTIVAQKLEAAATDRSAWAARIEAADFAAIEADPALMRIVRETGRTLFGDNGAACHGRHAEGGSGKGYPSLVDAAWLWGGAPATVAETIRVGINAAHPDTRTSQMLAFGRDGTLDRAQILSVAAYVQSLSQPALASGAEAAAVAAGKEVFAANCVACHGEDGKGLTETGAPNLADGFWLYGGDRQSIFTTVYWGRQGVMPSWEHRLSALDRKILALYVLDLGGSKR
jgi:cytochrome c oxidase cbb3-type subunit 3